MIKFPIDLKNINLKSDQPQAKILIISIATLVLILYFLLILQPQLARLADLLSKVGKMHSDIKAAESDIAKTDQFKRDVGAYKEKVDYYEKRLPVEQEIPNFLESISDMAKDANIKILGITPAPPSFKEPLAQKSKIYREMPVLIAAKSGYHELGNFLSSLENADRFMKVVDIDIKSNRSTPKKHDVELVISTFILLKGK